MTTLCRPLLLLATAWMATLLLAARVGADSRTCQKALGKAFAVLAKQTLKRMTKCLDKDNAGKLPGPCPDTVTAAKLAVVGQKVEGKIAKACTLDDAAALGFSGSCNLALPEASSAEAACGALPVTTAAGFATCITCWQRADLFEWLALLYASHAIELCGGMLGSDSTVCSQGGCAALLEPVPDQRDLGGGAENDCQRGIAKAGNKYLSQRAKLLAKCALGGGARETCLGDPKVQLRLAKAAGKKAATIAAECRNLRPVANTPFCCRTGGNSCLAVTDREDCVAAGGQAQEGKTCGTNNRCSNAPGGRSIPWWSQCPRRACGSIPVTDIAGLDACTQDKADETVDAVLCYRFPGAGWPCPSSPSGAFLEPHA